MTLRAPLQRPNSFIEYYAEPLPGKRGQMRCDIVIDGKLAQSYDVGSPAPWATVAAHERKVVL